MSSLGPLLSAHNFQTFIHVVLVLNKFLFTAFSAGLCISSPEISENLEPFFFQNKSVIVFGVVIQFCRYITITLK